MVDQIFLDTPKSPFLRGTLTVVPALLSYRVHTSAMIPKTSPGK